MASPTEPTRDRPSRRGLLGLAGAAVAGLAALVGRRRAVAENSTESPAPAPTADDGDRPRTPWIGHY